MGGCPRTYPYTEKIDAIIACHELWPLTLAAAKLPNGHVRPDERLGPPNIIWKQQSGNEWRVGQGGEQALKDLPTYKGPGARFLR